MSLAKYTALGNRGICGASRDNFCCPKPLEEYLRESNQQTGVLAQIESLHAASQVRLLAELNGIDAFFGPAGYSRLASVAGQFDSEVVRNAMADTPKAAWAAGNRFSTFTKGKNRSVWTHGSGATLLAYGGDLHFIRDALFRIRDQFGLPSNPLGDVMNGAVFAW